MNPKIKFFYDKKMIESAELPKFIISNKSVDRIINDVVERNGKAVIEING